MQCRLFKCACVLVAERAVGTIVSAAAHPCSGLDILVVIFAKLAQIVDQKPTDFFNGLDANVAHSWSMAEAATAKFVKAAWARCWPSGRRYGLSRIGGGRQQARSTYRL